MKKRIIFCTIAIALVIVLFLVARWSMADRKIVEAPLPKLTYKELFVEVKSDTLEYYITQFFKNDNHPSLKISSGPDKLVIEYNRDASILLNIIDNGMNAEREELGKSGVITDDAQKTRITLTKHELDGTQYVSCPSPILSEILRIKINQQESYVKDDI